MSPVTPSATTSGTDPRRRATTGVPQAERLGHDQPKRLGPIDRVQQGERVAEEFGFLRVADLADELDPAAAEQRLATSRS